MQKVDYDARESGQYTSRGQQGEVGTSVRQQNQVHMSIRKKMKTRPEAERGRCGCGRTLLRARGEVDPCEDTKWEG